MAETTESEIKQLASAEQYAINLAVARAPKFARIELGRELNSMFLNEARDVETVFDSKGKTYRLRIIITRTVSELGHDLIVINVSLHPTAKDVSFTSISEA